MRRFTQSLGQGAHASALAVFFLAAFFLAATLQARAGEVVVADGAITPHVTSLYELRFARVIKQQFDFSCGSAAVANLLTFAYGRPVSEKDVFSLMWAKGDQASIRKVGFSLLDMQSYLTAIGLNSSGYKVEFDQIAKVGLPAITLVTIGSYHHFVVIRGVRDDTVLVADPALGLRRISRDGFQKIWSGVLFVVTDDTAIGQAHFNAPEDWSILPSSPLARGMDQRRLGLTSLFLSLPLRNEF